MKTLARLLTVLSLMVGGSVVCFAQQTVSASLGTIARPTEGVQHPDLDKAWAVYDAAVTPITESIRDAISKQFDAATAKGDLDVAKKWQAVGVKFETDGELPTEAETKATVIAAVGEHKRARRKLVEAYKALAKNLTMEKKIAEAELVVKECSDIGAEPEEGPKEILKKLAGTWRGEGSPVVRVIRPNGKLEEFNRQNGKPHAQGVMSARADGVCVAELSNGYSLELRLSEDSREVNVRIFNSADGKKCGEETVFRDRGR